MDIRVTRVRETKRIFLGSVMLQFSKTPKPKSRIFLDDQFLPWEKLSCDVHHTWIKTMKALISEGFLLILQ